MLRTFPTKIVVAVGSVLGLAAGGASAHGDDFLRQLQMSDGYTSYNQPAPTAREKAGAKGPEGPTASAKESRLHQWFEQQRMLTDGNSSYVPETSTREPAGVKGREGVTSMSQKQICQHYSYEWQRAYTSGNARLMPKPAGC